MFKIHSHYLLLLTLVVSTAHAPSFTFWRHAGNAADATVAVSEFSSSRAALPREYAEDGDLKRFQLDELYLPSLDVSLPELFDWSHLEREYVADVGAHFDSLIQDSDSARGATIRVASLMNGPMFETLGAAGFGRSRVNNAAGPSSQPADASQAGKGDAVSSSPADETTPSEPASGSPETNAPGGGHPLTDPPPSILDPVGPELEPAPGIEPVAVPAPGALGLVVLGLAGLRLAGRKKKQKRLAAS